MINRYIFLVALLIYGAFAIFNTGYYHPDEHFQIVEFAEFKDGKNLETDLAWEYREKIRPAIQPAIILLFIKGLDQVNISDPYKVMSIVRLITAIISVVIIRAFIRATQRLVDTKLQIAYQLLSYFLWFIPFVNVRFSSENYACLSFLLALTIVMNQSQRKKYFLIGILLGLSFLFRFQTAFLSIGLILWLYFISKISLFKISLVLLGGLIMVNIGALIDYWFYKEYTYTFLNYFISNIVDDVASSFGTSPWYFYFTEFIHIGIYPISLIVICSLLIILFFHPKNVLIWIIVPFIVAHCFVPHKELRFLFPLVNFIPLIIILALQLCIKQRLFEGKNNIFLKSFLGIAGIVNLVALIVLMCSPADRLGQINITHYIHSNYRKDVTLWYLGQMNPYKPITPKQTFYYNHNIEQAILDPDGNLEQFDKSKKNLIVIQRHILLENHRLFKTIKINHLTNGFPNWVNTIKAFFRYASPSKSYVLYEVNLAK